jgi:glutamate--cysteine ligase
MTVIRSTGLSAAVAQLFSPRCATSLGRVGVEIEQFPLRERHGTHEVVHHDELLALLGPNLAAEARVSFEPGGQLEISPPPAASPTELFENTAGLLSRLDACVSPAGVRLEARGVNRWVDCDRIGLRLATERYQRMQTHFDAIGPDGRRMMRQTAALQICLDLLPGSAGTEQWQVLNLAGPVLAAAFNNPLPGEAHTPSRMSIWLGVDSSRTGFDGQYLCADPIDGYVAFAEQAEAIPLETNRAEHGPLHLPLGVWAAANRSRPDAADVRHHLSTLFPPVRPRGSYLEVRYVDSMPWPSAAVPVCVLATFSYEPRARHEVLEAQRHGPAGRRQLWQQSAQLGLAEPRLAEAARELFEIALRGMDRLPRGYLPANADRMVHDYLDRCLTSAASGGLLPCASR